MVSQLKLFLFNAQFVPNDNAKSDSSRSPYEQCERGIIVTVPVYKVLLVGEANVGKSSLIRRLILDDFDEQYCATIGVDLSAVAINIDPVTPVILTVIDLGGQSEFSSLRTQYYKGAHYVVLVYDITKRDSFEKMHFWYEGLMEHLSSSESSNLPGVVCANKIDLEASREVTATDGRIYADSLNWPYRETSAKSGLNVQESFVEIAKTLYSQKPPRNP
jgi:small GTP-binding protein